MIFLVFFVVGAHRPPKFNTSIPHKDQTFLAPKIPQFNTNNLSFQHENPSVPHQKPLSSTPKPPHFHIKNSSVPHTDKNFVELRGFWCGTEGFWGLKKSGPFVWNWCVDLRGCGSDGDPSWPYILTLKANQALGIQKLFKFFFFLIM